MKGYVSYPNRTLCDVLDDMRRCFDTLNFSPMKSLIEEAQVIGNRMEAGLGDNKDLGRLREMRSNLIKEVELLEKRAKKQGLSKERINEIEDGDE